MPVKSAEKLLRNYVTRMHGAQCCYLTGRFSFDPCAWESMDGGVCRKAAPLSG